MSAVMDNDNKEYQKLIKRFPLRPIRDDEQNEIAAGVCDSLTDHLDSLSPAEQDYLEVLSDLIAKYESKWQSDITEMSPREFLEYLMDQNGLAQKDLIGEFGSASRVSEFLKGSRELSVGQARRLAQRFCTNISAWIDVTEDRYAS